MATKSKTTGKHYVAPHMLATKSTKNTGDTRNFDTVFARLKQILVPYAKYMTVSADGARAYTLVAPYKRNKAKRFGGVAIRRNHVTFYSCPTLLRAAPPALKQRMQGAASLNFTEIDDSLIQQLRKLTENRFENYQAGSW